MLIPRLLLSDEPQILSEEDYENSPEHLELKERLRKTLYYGKTPKNDRLSLPVTEIAVELLQNAAPRELGKVDEFVASSLSRKSSVSPCALVIGLIYIERLKHRNPEYLQQISSSDLFLISMMVASKYLYDEGTEEEVFNDEWSDSAKMEVHDLNELERNFLSAIDWNLFVKATDFRKVLNNVERRVVARKARERGYWIYSDLIVMMETQDLLVFIQTVLEQICQVVLVCSVAYVAGVFMLQGSVLSLAYVKTHAVTPAVSSTIPAILSSQPVKSHKYELAKHVNKDSQKLGKLIQDIKPTFHTLATVGQILMQFVSALKDQKTDLNNNSHLEWTVDSENGFVCSCGCCVGDTDAGCHNTTKPAGVPHNTLCWRHTTQDDPYRDAPWCQTQQCCCPVVKSRPWFMTKLTSPIHDIRVGFETSLGLVDAIS